MLLFKLGSEKTWAQESFLRKIHRKTFLRKELTCCFRSNQAQKYEEQEIWPFFHSPPMRNSYWQIWSGRDSKGVGASEKTISKQLHDPKLPFLCRQEVRRSPAYLCKRSLPPRFAACHREKEKIYRYSSMATYTILRADEVVKLYFRSGHLFLKFLSEVFFF